MSARQTVKEIERMVNYRAAIPTAGLWMLVVMVVSMVIGSVVIGLGYQAFMAETNVISIRVEKVETDGGHHLISATDLGSGQAMTLTTAGLYPKPEPAAMRLLTPGAAYQVTVYRNPNTGIIYLISIDSVIAP